MKILITGAGGMLGSDLASRLAPMHDVLGAGRKPAPHLKISFETGDLSQFEFAHKLTRSFRPEIILHSAAMTDVDGCEADRKAALRGNFEMTQHMVNLANQFKAFLIFFSTDYVFDGVETVPYKETDIPHPINIYGESKLLAERYVVVRGNRFLILRAAWTFGKNGNNFPKKILQQAPTGKPIKVLSDQWGSPTFTGHLADGVVQILERLPKAGEKCKNQIYHIAGQGKVSRFDFAKSILKKWGYPESLVESTTGDGFVRPAKRPQNSVFSTEKLKTQFGIQMPGWEDGLEAYFDEESIKNE